MTRREGLIAAIALVLLATVVVGSENRRHEERVVPKQAVAAPSPIPQPQPGGNEELDVEKLYRPSRAQPIVDVFAHKALPVPLPAVLRETPPPVAAEPAAPAPPPAPPALPFRLVGKFVENATTRLLLANGDKEHNVSGGETLEGTYRVDSISDHSVAFTYLPMNAAQTLALTPPGEAGQ